MLDACEPTRYPNTAASAIEEVSFASFADDPFVPWFFAFLASVF